MQLSRILQDLQRHFTIMRGGQNYFINKAHPGEVGQVAGAANHSVTQRIAVVKKSTYQTTLFGVGLDA
jgi:hypothetical protein